MKENVIKINENGESVFEGNRYRIDINDHDGFKRYCPMIIPTDEPVIQMYKNEYEWTAMHLNDFKCSAAYEDTHVTFEFFKRAVEHWLGDSNIYDTAEGWFENLYQRWMKLTVISIDEDGKFRFKGNEYRIEIIPKDGLQVVLFKDNIPSAFVSSSKLKEDVLPTEEYSDFKYSDFKRMLNYFIEDVWFYRQVLEIHASEEWYRKMYTKLTGRVPYSSRLIIKSNWNK